MKKSIIWRSFLTTLSALVIFAVVSGFLISYYNNQATKRELYRTGSVYEEILTSGLLNYDEAAAFGTKPDLRVTIIAENGNVLADSNADAGSMTNHSGREEFEAALAGEDKTFIRKSNTTGIRMMYYAKKLKLAAETVVLRIAIPTSSINSYVLSSVLTLVLLTGCVLLFSYLISKRAYQRVLQPLTLIKKGMRNINNGTYTEIVPRFKDSDLNEALEEINLFSGKIRTTLAENEREKEKLNYILDNMGQGLVVVNGERNIALINREAGEIFRISEDITGKNFMYLTREQVFLQAVDNVMENRVSVTFDHPVGAGTYSATVSSLLSDWTGSGKEECAAVITLRDVTEARGAERIRSEFFANASHELKTPLTSVKGFSELLLNGMVTEPEKVKDYISRISTDSNRMLTLIEDMLKLSHLDEGKQEGEVTEVDLAQIAADVIKELTPQAEKKKVTLIPKLSACKVIANRENMLELIGNLADNAVKYNLEGGSVTLATDIIKGRATLTVTDTGIGIAPQHQSRIFERFYRVDKGRSRSAGGTGLGLAIVKHIASVYRAEVTLKSELKKGTEIRVSFPTND